MMKFGHQNFVTARKQDVFQAIQKIIHMEDSRIFVLPEHTKVLVCAVEYNYLKVLGVQDLHINFTAFVTTFVV